MIFKEFLNSYCLIWFEALRNIVMRLEEIIEFVSTFLNSLRSILHIWMSSWIKFAFHLINLQNAISVIIKLLESLSNEIDTVIIERPQDSMHELFKIDGTISVSIKCSEYLLSFFL